MAVTRISQSSLKEGLEKANNFMAGFAPLGMDYHSIATITVGSGGASSIEFTSIPGTYQHLQLRGIYKSTDTDGGSPFIQANGSSSLTRHSVYGDGATTGADAAAVAGNSNRLPLGSNRTGHWTAFVGDVLDYANTTKNTTFRWLVGVDMNGSGGIWIHSNLYTATTAVTSLRFTPQATAWAQHSTFALYGLRAP